MKKGKLERKKKGKQGEKKGVKLVGNEDKKVRRKKQQKNKKSKQNRRRNKHAGKKVVEKAVADPRAATYGDYCSYIM
jgi:hypothetical protein